MARQDSGLHVSAMSPSLRLELDIFFFFKLNEQHILAEKELMRPAWDLHFSSISTDIQGSTP